MVAIFRIQPRTPKSSDTDTHEWKLVPRVTQKRIYHCNRCDSVVTVEHRGTMGAAMRARGISEICDEELVKNVMES
jgi:hypothetical protein